MLEIRSARHRFAFWWRLIVFCFCFLTRSVDAMMETAEVLPPGVPNFILEFMYSVDDKAPVDVSKSYENFGLTYHFGVGFPIGPVRNDLDIYRRFGPAFATESGIVLETQVVSEHWAAYLPSVSLTYGYDNKASDIRKIADFSGESSSFHCFRHGGVISKTFQISNIARVTPFFGIQGDLIINAGNSWTGAAQLGAAVRPWFLEVVRAYVEIQARLADGNLNAISAGLEVVLIPTVEGKNF